MAFQGIVLVAISLVLAGRGLADDYPHKTAEPQPTGWPLSEEEKTHILKAEHERRPGSESTKHLPELWPVLPSAGFWSGTSWLDTHAKLVEHVKESKGMVDFLLVGDTVASSHIITHANPSVRSAPLKRTMLLVAAAVGLIITGCGQSGEKGKNKEKDMPKAPDLKKA